MDFASQTEAVDEIQIGNKKFQATNSTIIR